MPAIIEKYKTVNKEYGPEEIKEKGSRFISYLYPVKKKEKAEAIIQKLRKKFHDSTHVCFAYRIGEGEEEYFRYSDDGEPSGTAGAPIYNEIKSKDYYNVLAAVVRYYGGTKLGTGGLARAYGQAAKKAIEISEEVTQYIKKEVFLSFPYHFTGEMMRIVNKYNLKIIFREDTAEGIHMTLAVPVALVDDVAQAVIKESSGKIKIDNSG